MAQRGLAPRFALGPLLIVVLGLPTIKHIVEEADVTYAGGFPEDYSDVFGAPAAALPAF